MPGGGSGYQATATFATAGVHTVTASVGTSSRSLLVTNVAVSFNPAPVVLCHNGATSVVSVLVTPASALDLLTFDAEDATIATVARNGTNASVVVTSGVVGTTRIRALLNGHGCGTATVHSASITFGTNHAYTGKGLAVQFPFTINPTNALSALNFTSTVPGVLNATREGTNAVLTGLSNGTTLVKATIGGSPLCGELEATCVEASITHKPVFANEAFPVTVAFTVLPTNAPVSFQATNQVDATVTLSNLHLQVQGVNVGTNELRILLQGTNVLDSSPLYVVRLIQTNDYLATAKGAVNTNYSLSLQPEGFLNQLSACTDLTNQTTLAFSGTNIVVSGGTNGAKGFFYCALGAYAISLPKPVYVVDLKLTSLIYTGNGFRTIVRDDGSSYHAEHWCKTNQSPALLVASNPHSAILTFDAVPDIWDYLDCAISIYGAGPYTYQTNQSIALGTTQWYATTSTNIPAHVDMRTNLVTTWMYSIAGSQYTTSGSSTNWVYVGLAPAAGSIRHTVAHLACSVTGATNSAQAFTNTWHHFSGPGNVKSWDDHNLFYYRPGIPWASNVYSFQDLLLHRNGQCGAWRSLFISALEVNGVSATNYTVSATEQRNFLVGNWTYGNASLTNETVYRYLLVLSSNNGSMVPIPQNSAYGDLTSNTGLPGQNSETPAEKVFGRHFIVRVSDTYYDPSYGSMYTNAWDIQNKCIAGYAVLLGSFGTNMFFKVSNTDTNSLGITLAP